MAGVEKYKKLFLTEADEKINALNKALLELEKKPASANAVNDAMRAAHTLKSSAAAMNFMGISHLAHAMEDLFEQARSKKHRLEPGALEILFENVDILSSAVKAIKNEKPEPDMKAALERLQKTGNRFQVLGSMEDKKNLTPNTYNLTPSLEPIEAIKVDVAALDRLMNLTEELLVERMRLSQIVSSFELLADRSSENESLKANSYKLKAGNMTALKSSSENFNRLFSDLQFNVVQARMVPLGQIFERFPRMIRDLAKEQKKEVDFEMRGQEIELDRTIIDRLGEPLIHLLRNAVDHGILESGVITLSAERERDKVLIKVENDGSSIDWEKVVETAMKKNIISAEKGNAYIADIKAKSYKLKAEIEDLLYLGRLSTNEKVTEVSGRGVGLSIVKRAIESFGGKVFIESPVKQADSFELLADRSSENESLKANSYKLKAKAAGGTRFTLELPLTLAIIQALLVRVASQTFALPFSQIDRSVRVPMKNIKKAFDQEVAVVEEEDIPLVRLEQLFGANTAKKEGLFFTEEELQETKHQLRAELMVITKSGEKQAGIVIDELISEQDIVVKPLKGILKKSKGFAGVTLLGDGRPALILDVASLI